MADFSHSLANQETQKQIQTIVSSAANVQVDHLSGGGDSVGAWRVGLRFGVSLYSGSMIGRHGNPAGLAFT